MKCFLFFVHEKVNLSFKIFPKQKAESSQFKHNLFCLNIIFLYE